ncbi:MAG: DUF3427 domain-containing protein, partial [Clostridia bacterium]
RSVQIAFALSSLAENFVVEKRLLISLVKDNFAALNLAKYGLEINVDDLSKEEIINYIENENFNSLNYMKQDYFNFKKYINSEFAPRHMDYLNNDCAPDLIRFMNIKIGGRKNKSYYNFLKGIYEADLPVFSEQQVNFLNYLSDMLPLVRQNEYLIVKNILDENNSINAIKNALANTIIKYTDAQFNHAIKFMLASKLITLHNEIVSIQVPIDDQYREWIKDLINYGLTRYIIDFGDTEDFKLWSSYRMDQVQLKLCKNPKHNQLGTYVYDGIVYIFASIKKDASIQEHLNYKDKFLQPDMFQWECQAGLNEGKQRELIQSKKAYLFIRKVESENGLVLPFTFVGTGKLENPRKTENVKGSLLFDIHLETELSDYLQYDFGLEK